MTSDLSKMQFVLVGAGDGEVITVFKPGNKPLVAHSTHPNFDAIKDGAHAGDEGILDLFDVAETAANKFQQLTSRIHAENGRLYLDGAEVDDALSKQIVHFLSAGEKDWQPLVRFYDKLLANPNAHSREQLYSWLKTHNFTITASGDIVGYKGVDSSFMSMHSGGAFVDGVEVKGRVPNNPGSVIEMLRSDVAANPSVGCSTGLHVGTFEYARSFASKVLEIHVNPSDVVSVPTDCSAAKMRACKYRVVKEYTKAEAHTAPVVADAPEPEKKDEKVQDEPVNVGDKFEDTDKRRAGRTITVVSTHGNCVKVKAEPSGVESEILVERLLSRRYRKV